MGPLMWELGQDWVVGMLAPEKERKAASERLGGKEMQDPRNTTTPWQTTCLWNFMGRGELPATPDPGPSPGLRPLLLPSSRLFLAPNESYLGPDGEIWEFSSL